MAVGVGRCSERARPGAAAARHGPAWCLGRCLGGCLDWCWLGLCLHGRSYLHGRGCGCGQVLSRRWLPGGGPVTEAGRVQAAERGVERRDVAELRVVGEQREDVGVRAEHVVGEALQRLLRPDLDEYPRPRVVQGPQALDPLDGRRDLAAQHVEHLLGHIAGP